MTPHRTWQSLALGLTLLALNSCLIPYSEGRFTRRVSHKGHPHLHIVPEKTAMFTAAFARHGSGRIGITMEFYMDRSKSYPGKWTCRWLFSRLGGIRRYRSFSV